MSNKISKDPNADICIIHYSVFIILSSKASQFMDEVKEVYLKTLKGSKHSCGFTTPPDNKNPAAILFNLLLDSS